MTEEEVRAYWHGYEPPTSWVNNTDEGRSYGLWLLRNNKLLRQSVYARMTGVSRQTISSRVRRGTLRVVIIGTRGYVWPNDEQANSVS